MNCELPKQIDHPMHSEHPLQLLAKPPYESETCECQVCKKSCRNSVYHCSSCEIDIDISCAFLEDDVVIPTHHHPLRLVRRPASFKCNACDVEEQDSESYMCTEPLCGFWIHKKCGSLPEMFERPDHNHPLRLAICMPVRYRKYNFTCEICIWCFKYSAWIYYCRRCKYFIHIKCRTEKAPSPPSRRLPFHNVYPPTMAMIRQLYTIMEQTAPRIAINSRITRLPVIKVIGHKHPLELINDHNQDGDDDDEILCDGCIEPIDHATSSYFKCEEGCNFLLHTTCAALPRHHEISESGFGTPHLCMFELCFPENPWEVVKCFACNSFCNVYSYKCLICNVSLDVKCAYLFELILHIGHNHYLSGNNFTSLSEFTCSCGNTMSSGLHFRCDPCKFILGYECATLPAVVKHRWDKHVLVLCFPPHIRDNDEDDEFYCEVCEEEIHPKRWMYRCDECDQSFHSRCIPTLGESRNIKLGKMVSIKSHPHPLTLVPQAKLTNLCCTCRKSLYWNRAFECADCGFYLCPDCIPKEELVAE